MFVSCWHLICERLVDPLLRCRILRDADVRRVGEGVDYGRVAKLVERMARPVCKRYFLS